MEVSMGLVGAEGCPYLNELIKSEQRVAITCFENDVSYCHRGVIAKKMKSGFKVEVKHL
jgi:uncharacterized protein (DUF488 family)